MMLNGLLTRPHSPSQSDYSTLAKAYVNRLREYDNLLRSYNALTAKNESLVYLNNSIRKEYLKAKHKLSSQKGLSDKIEALTKENDTLKGYALKYELLTSLLLKLRSRNSDLYNDLKAIYFHVVTAVKTRSFEPLLNTLQLFKEYEPDNAPASQDHYAYYSHRL